MRILIIAFMCLCGFSATAFAHDFWLAPNVYHMDKQGGVNVSVMVGHPIDRSKWPTDVHRVVSFNSIDKDGIHDQQASLKKFSEQGYLRAQLRTDGTHILVMETAHARNVLPAEAFNAYLAEEGLSLIRHERIKTGTQSKPGREIYSRRGKSIVQVGALNEQSDQLVTKPVGLTLEIVPQVNPYRLATEAPMPMRIYYRGAPIAGVKVLLISLDTIVGEISMSKTNAQGLVTFKRPPRGSWMVHAVWSSPIQGDDNADFDTIFSSLSFGFE